MHDEASQEFNLLHALPNTRFGSVDDAVAAIERWAADAVQSGALFRSATFIAWDPDAAWADLVPMTEPPSLQLLPQSPTDIENPLHVKSVTEFAATLRASAVIHVARVEVRDAENEHEEVEIAVEDLTCGVYLRVARIVGNHDGRERLAAFATDRPFDFDIKLAPWRDRPPFPRIVR